MMNAKLGGKTSAKKDEERVFFRDRFGAVALVVAGVLFFLYPALRPFSDEVTLQGASAFASWEWVAAHVMAIVAFILMPAGLFSLYVSLQQTSGGRLALGSLIFSWTGIGLTLPFYGAEVFGLYAIGLEAIHQQNVQLIGLASDIRFGPGFLMIVAGLILLGIGTVLAAAAIWRSGIAARWSGIPLAIGFLLYLPQYMGTQPVRIAHGLLIAIGCVWIALSMYPSTRHRERRHQA